MANPFDEFDEASANPFDEFDSEVEKTSFSEDFNLSLANVKNTFTKTKGLIKGATATALGDTELADDYYREMEQVTDQRLKDANPQGKEQSFGGKLAGLVSTLPAQLVAMPMSPFDTGQELVRAGESLPVAAGGAVVDAGMNALGLGLPGAVGKTVLGKTASGFAINAAQDFAARKAISGMASTEEAKEKFQPSWETTGLAGVLGASIGAVHGVSTKKKAKATEPTRPRAADVISQEKAAAEGAEVGGLDLSVDPFAQMKRQLDTPQTNEGPFIPDDVLAERQMGPQAFDAMAEHLEGVPARQADQLAAERQAQLELETKRRATLDYNAAERRRQEAAPTGYERSPEAIARDPDVSKMDERITKQEETVIKLAGAVEDGTLPKSHLDRALRDLGYMEESLANMKQLVEAEVAERTQTRPGYPAFEEKSGSFIPELPLRGPRGQRGMVNPDVFKEGFEKIKQVGDYTLRLIGRSFGPEIAIIDANGNEIGGLSTVANWKKNEQVLTGDFVKVQPAHRRKGLAEAAYKMLAETGNDVHKSSALLPDGKAMWNRFEEKGLAKNGMIRSPGNRQMGGIYMGAEPVPPKPREDSLSHPTDPATIAEKSKQRKFVESFPVGKEKLLDEFRNVTTKEEAITLASDPNVKDILRDIGQKQLGSGIGYHAAMSNHPILKFARYAYKEVRTAAEQFSRKYVTDKDIGVTSVWNKMKPEERIGVMEALQEGDRQQYQLTDSVMDKLGFNEHQRQFAKTFYEANRQMWDKWVKTLEENGLRVPKQRTGHFPGIFSGSYKTLVMVPKVDEAGNPVMRKGVQVKETVGIVATDTIYQQKAAREWFKKQHPGAVFIEQKRSGLSGSSPRYYSDIFSGMNDILDMLGREDPRFADVQDLVQRAIVEGNNKLFNFNVHELAKKGIVGNEGNRPWLDAKKNADDAFKALVRYFEEGTLHHELQVPLKEMREIANHPELSKKFPNTMKLLDDYTKKVTGADLSPLGAAINTFIDLPFKLTGIGSGVPIRWAGVVKNNMSQLFMGYGNYMFTASQLMQPMQTALPFFQMMATRLDLDLPSAAASMGRGGNHFMMSYLEDVSGKQMDIVPQHMREAYSYAKERGLITFSEIERAYQGTQGKASQMKDRIAEANMKIGEVGTRTPMFMGYVDVMVNAGIDVKAALPIAEHMTQFSMIDYHAWERPMLYSKMGVLGQFAGGLQTFKHGLMSQQAYLGKQMFRPAAGSKQIKPIALSMVAMLTLAGITGSPFYNEMDALVMYLTDKFGGEAKSIRELALQNAPEWLNTGVLSNMLDLNIQNKFSSADMVPDSLGKAGSPHLEAAFKIIAAAYEAAKNGADEQSVRNLLLQLSPSAWKGVAEMTTARDAQNYLIGKDGLRAGSEPRTDEEWTKRAVTGLRPQREAVEREITWTARIKQRKDQERLKEISAEYRRRIINNTLDKKAAARLEEEYGDRGGDIKTLLQLNRSVGVEQQLTEKERLGGIPKSQSGVNRWQYFNK